MKSKVRLQKLEDYSLDRVEQFVRDSLEVLDPEASMFRPGHKVLLKPNLLKGFKPERCVTTHPVVVEAVCRVLKDIYRSAKWLSATVPLWAVYLRWLTKPGMDCWRKIWCRDPALDRSYPF